MNINELINCPICKSEFETDEILNANGTSTETKVCNYCDITLVQNYNEANIPEENVQINIPDINTASKFYKEIGEKNDNDFSDIYTIEEEIKLDIASNIDILVIGPSDIYQHNCILTHKLYSERDKEEKLRLSAKDAGLEERTFAIINQIRIAKEEQKIQYAKTICTDSEYELVEDIAERIEDYFTCYDTLPPLIVITPLLSGEAAEGLQNYINDLSDRIAVLLLIETKLTPLVTLDKAIDYKIEEFKNIDSSYISVLCQNVLNDKEGLLGLLAAHIMRKNIFGICQSNYFAISSSSYIVGIDWNNTYSKKLTDHKFLTLRTYAGLQGLFWYSSSIMNKTSETYKKIENFFIFIILQRILASYSKIIESRNISIDSEVINPIIKNMLAKQEDNKCGWIHDIELNIDSKGVPNIEVFIDKFIENVEITLRKG